MRILLVEDEEKVRRFITRGLEAEGYAVDAVEDAHVARDSLLGSAYDAAILDINLPAMSGTELLQEIRRENARLPVLMLTARDSLEDKVRNFEGLTNIVDVYIRQLRRKIDEEHELKLIRTVRGVGYVIGSTAS